MITKYAALDAGGALIGLYDSKDGAAGACQDAANEADSDGEGYAVEERWLTEDEIV